MVTLLIQDLHYGLTTDMVNVGLVPYHCKGNGSRDFYFSFFAGKRAFSNTFLTLTKNWGRKADFAA